MLKALLGSFFRRIRFNVDNVLESVFPSFDRAKETYPNETLLLSEAVARNSQGEFVEKEEGIRGGRCLLNGVCPNCGSDAILNLKESLVQASHIGIFTCSKCPRIYVLDGTSGEMTGKTWDLDRFNAPA